MSALIDNYNNVRLVRQHRDVQSVWVPDRYEFNARGKWPWLQRRLFKILGKLKAYSYDQRVTYSTTEIDTTKILDAIMRNQHDVAMLMRGRAKYVVMGIDEFAEVSNDPAVRDFMRFNFNANVSDGYYHQTMLGLECVVVPWIKGFFVLPDLEGRL